MASWRYHILFSFLFLIPWLGFLLTLDLIHGWTMLISLFILNIFASLIPDVDTSKSKIRNYVSLILALLLTFYLLPNLSSHSSFSLLLLPVSIYFLMRYFPTQHRGFTHTISFSLIFSILLSTILWFLLNFSTIEFLIYFLTILLGYISHLLLDMIT